MALATCLGEAHWAKMEVLAETGKSQILHSYQLPSLPSCACGAVCPAANSAQIWPWRRFFIEPSAFCCRLSACFGAFGCAAIPRKSSLLSMLNQAGNPELQRKE
jgi:hypothetical protein